MAVAALSCTLILTTSSTARAEECRELGAIGVALGMGIGLGAVVVTSLVAPAIVTSQDASLLYGEGVAVGALTGTVGVLGGAYVSTTHFCDQGLWLPGASGVALSVASTGIWAAAASEPAAQRAFAAPDVAVFRIRFE